MGRVDDMPPPPPPFDGVQGASNHKVHNQPRSTPPQQFPPLAQSQDYEDVPQNYPPPQHEIPHNFPPSQQVPQQPQMNYYQQQQQQPGGVPMGHPVGPQGAMPMPSPYVPQAIVPNQQAWKTGLFDCMQDPQNAIITLCFPCVTFGQVAEIADSGATSCATSGMWYSLIACCIGMPCIMSCTYRSKMRAVFGLVESPAPDWIIHCFCEYCALCQEYREMKERGYDPSIGWAGNQAVLRQKQQAAMAAPMQQRMM